jgi:hypothetical protein
MNQKAIRVGVSGLVAAFELMELLVESEGLCSYCGIEVPPMGGSFDHVVPYALGGENRKDNIVRCCLSCNRTKALKTPEELAVYAVLRVRCANCQREFRPRYADWKRGLGRTCSRACAGAIGGRS